MTTSAKKTDYIRVLPRDAFNEAKLLKCIGKITLLIEDRFIPDWQYHYDGEPFNIMQSQDDGSISIGNITFWKNKKQIDLYTPLNSKSNWPLMAVIGEEFEDVFNENGEFILS